LNYGQVVDSLRDTGVLLLSDKTLPSVVGLVGGPGVKGSWWAHEKGRDIWRILRRLDDDPDVMVTRLVSGKVTYLHRRLWPAFLTVATSGEPWQTKGLSPVARRLIGAINKAGQIRMDRYAEGRSPKTVKAAAAEIERRLLAYTDEIHTEKGSHAKILMTWSRCPKLGGERFQIEDLAASKGALEDAVGDADLPWRKII